MMTTESYLYRRTKRAVLDGSGRDPLGLSRVSVNFTELLLPSTLKEHCVLQIKPLLDPI